MCQHISCYYKFKQSYNFTKYNAVLVVLSHSWLGIDSFKQYNEKKRDKMY